VVQVKISWKIHYELNREIRKHQKNVLLQTNYIEMMKSFFLFLNTIKFSPKQLNLIDCLSLIVLFFVSLDREINMPRNPYRLSKNFVNLGKIRENLYT